MGNRTTCTKTERNAQDYQNSGSCIHKQTREPERVYYLFPSERPTMHSRIALLSFSARSVQDALFASLEKVGKSGSKIVLESSPSGAVTKRFAYERPATAPGTREAKYRSVNDAICSKPELNVAGRSNEKNYAQKVIA
nr:hypothetical protein Iba_chr05bCG3370 [Ipomoea batatas]